jgi:hypothetical protein
LARLIQPSALLMTAGSALDSRTAENAIRKSAASCASRVDPSAVERMYSFSGD